MSEIKVDTLTGKTSAGDITVTSEGGAATQSLQQGLAKVWCNTSGVGTPAVSDSLNVTSISDLGTGNNRFNLVSAMSNANFATQGLPDHNSSIVSIQQVPDFGQTTTTTQLSVHTTSAGIDADVHLTVHGDLA